MIINLEIKGKNIGDIVPIVETVRNYTDNGQINAKDIVFSSFDHPILSALKKENPNFNIAPCIRTTLLYGKENVEMPGFMVKAGAKYSQEGLNYLQGFHNESPVAAMDTIFWDVDQPLVELAQRNNVALYASTSDFRDYSENASLTALHHMSKEVPLYFKADEPGKVREELDNIKRTFSEVNLSATTPVETRDIMSIDKQGLLSLPVRKPETYSNTVKAKQKTVGEVAVTPAVTEPAPAPVLQNITPISGLGQSDAPATNSLPTTVSTTNGPASDIPDTATGSHTTTQQTSTSRTSYAIKASNASIGVAMGAKGLYDKLANENSQFHKDIASGGTREALAYVSTTADAANLGVGAIDSTQSVAQAAKMTSAVSTTAQAAEGATGVLGIAKAVVGRAALPIAVAAGAAEAGTAIAAKDGHRTASAIGSTVGGVAAGVATSVAVGAGVGSVLPIAGTLTGAVVGLVAGVGGALLGGWLGGKAADAAAGDWIDKKLNESDISAIVPKKEATIPVDSIAEEPTHGLNNFSAITLKNNQTPYL